MNRPTTKPAYNPYTDEVEELRPPTFAPIDDNPGVHDADYSEELEDLELTLSAHETNQGRSYTKAFKGENAYSSSEQKRVHCRESRRNAMSRKGVIVSLAFVLVVVIVTIAVASSQSKKNGNSSELSVSGATSPALPVENDPDPDSRFIDTAAPVSVQKEAPVTTSPFTSPMAVTAPVAAPLPDPNSFPISPLEVQVIAPIPSPLVFPVATPVAAPVEAPKSVGACANDLFTDKKCYAVGEVIRIDFSHCDASIYDWVGFYKSGQVRNGTLYPNFYYYEYTCGPHPSTCETPIKVGTLYIYARVRPGEYQFHLMPGPLIPVVSTIPFVVSHGCHTNTKVGHENVEDTNSTEVSMPIGNSTVADMAEDATPEWFDGDSRA